MKLKMFITAGLMGSLIDIDHIFMLIREGLPITFYNLEENGSRLLHFPVFYTLAIYAMIMVILFVMSIGNSTKNKE
jgi:hypothetical protein